ncbi:MULTISPECIES: hypothetical protein [unclassified Tolypothrix]|uniref:hypothetical protein n=1 Tax=unclassified Tolypothrix TaxID=2649714 RepID=UPI0005EAA314|nr:MULTISPECIES: hypothetical protein [unclassified Tolypothrix]BAY88815.1 hypothetical protein NIES3275_08150 [Microchaete diplosiphon NIES-3275]EKF02774.1 hypothetical protein FDUTEX481_05574 [Tolypothrix sp. PCC 7601]MBE9083748.1 hypothetical protein [Tolypothrix sp. LEGE 11397]UYD29464.1 hypothetical protein HGR01_16440 [Tolypothrix sp. PCC 7712]UYD34624.1 hypothetical protein HG267_01865 [Tolypothrix sp. PCC 7601]
MGLAQTQQVLAQLYTNTEFRNSFFANPKVVGAELGLSDAEIENLSQLATAQVNLFANSLKWKRLNLLSKLLPRTAIALGKNFKTLFWRYAETYIPQGIKKHRQDAIAFADFITQTSPLEGLEPIWLSDLVRYEQAWLLAEELNHGLKVRWFRYAVDKLGNGEEIHPQLTICVWWRFQTRSPLHHTVRSLF